MEQQKIYNIKSSLSFVDELAKIFLNEYGDKQAELAGITFLLPNRRACQNLTDAFVRECNKMPVILPKILPVADVDEDEILLTGNAEIWQNTQPEISAGERNMIFTKMIMKTPESWGLGKISLSQAYALAKNLSSLTDTVQNEDLSFANLSQIVPEEYAEHWNKILDLLKIVTEFWPQILQERGKEDIVKRRNKLLRAQMAIWRNNPPKNKIVVAGTTAGFPVLRELVKIVYDLPNGEIYLYGLDKFSDDKDWEQIDENHPQFELKELLHFLQIKRSMVKDIGEKQISPRERLVSEIMRPASSSGQWLLLNDTKIADSAFADIKIINCDDMRQEAYAIALIMRKTLEDKEKTAALVTSDRNLSRRVISELKRWDIEADDSSGQPLSLTQIGTFLRLILDVIEQNFSQVSVLALLKHPYTRCKMSALDFNNELRQLEGYWRGAKTAMPTLLNTFYQIIKPLADLYFSPFADLGEMLDTHIRVAENLADTDTKSGDKIIWRHDDGAAAAKFISNFMPLARDFGLIPSNEYSGFICSLLAEQNVRARYGYHPRVKILGQIEARLTQYDVTIIGEANEGVWPNLPNADMWMSRPMKKSFGMSSPEKSVGVSAADFAHLLSGKKVYITRADKVDGAPTNKSRWLLRLETVLRANFGKDKKNCSFIYDSAFAVWAKNYERADFAEIKRSKIKAPAPCPPVYARPRRIAATKIEQLMYDPYIIYARNILGLKPLRDLDYELGSLEYGVAIHSVLKDFVKKYTEQPPYPDYDIAISELTDMAEKEFAKSGVPAEILAFWRPKAKKQIEWFVNQENTYKELVKKSYPEVFGEIVYDLPAGKFFVEATADRVDIMKDGTLNIVDYKTGTAYTVNDMIRTTAPQLPTEGLIAKNGGFKDVNSGYVSALRYWKLGKEEVFCDENNTTAAIQNTDVNLRKILALYDFETTPYLSHPKAGKQTSCTDYDHLSRYYEWSVRDESKETEDADD